MKDCTGWGEEMGLFSSPPRPPQTDFYEVPCIPIALEFSGQLKNNPEVISVSSPQGHTLGLESKKYLTLQRSLIAALSYIKAHMPFSLAYLHPLHPLHWGLMFLCLSFRGRITTPTQGFFSGQIPFFKQHPLIFKSLCLYG